MFFPSNCVATDSRLPENATQISFIIIEQSKLQLEHTHTHTHITHITHSVYTNTWRYSGTSSTVSSCQGRYTLSERPRPTTAAPPLLPWLPRCHQCYRDTGPPLRGQSEGSDEQGGPHRSPFAQQPHWDGGLQLESRHPLAVDMWRASFLTWDQKLLKFEIIQESFFPASSLKTSIFCSREREREGGRELDPRTVAGSKLHDSYDRRCELTGTTILMKLSHEPADAAIYRNSCQQYYLLQSHFIDMYY